MTTVTKDVVIIGGGHNGLVAATYLAKAGKSVVILEANEEISGATASVRATSAQGRPNSEWSWGAPDRPGFGQICRSGEKKRVTSLLPFFWTFFRLETESEPGLRGACNGS